MSFLLKADKQVKDSKLHLFVKAQHLSIVAQRKGMVSFRGNQRGGGRGALPPRDLLALPFTPLGTFRIFAIIHNKTTLDFQELLTCKNIIYVPNIYNLSSNSFSGDSILIFNKRGYLQKKKKTNSLDLQSYLQRLAYVMFCLVEGYTSYLQGLHQNQTFAEEISKTPPST